MLRIRYDVKMKSLLGEICREDTIALSASHSLSLFSHPEFESCSQSSRACFPISLLLQCSEAIESDTSLEKVRTQAPPADAAAAQREESETACWAVVAAAAQPNLRGTRAAPTAACAARRPQGCGDGAG